MKAMVVRLLCFFFLAFGFGQRVVAGEPAADWSAAISEAAAFRHQGDIQRSLDILTTLQRTAEDPAIRAAAAGELGIALWQAHRYRAAEDPLRQAYAFFQTGAERARYAVYLGNLSVSRKQADEAGRFYREAFALSENDPDIRLGVGLNLVQLAPEGERPGKLGELSQQLARAGDKPEFIRHHLNLGHQARLLGRNGLVLAYRHLDQARVLSEKTGNYRLLAESLDELAQLYEDRGQKPEALQLTLQAIALARSPKAGNAADLLINLEWRQGRLQNIFARKPAALAAYQRAVEQIEAVRQDLPIETENGQSSFHQTLEPVYLGYIDLLLQQADTRPQTSQADDLRRVIATVELTRQSEMQDFLGDRCSVETVQGNSAGILPAGTAVLYPVILPDRLELLLETSSGIVRRSSGVKGGVLRASAVSFADALRNGDESFRASAQQLYDWLYRPLEDVLAEQHVERIVVVPDGALRLVPMAALHDGHRFAIEKFAISMVTGLTMTHSAVPIRRQVEALIAGVSVPGPVLEKIVRLYVDGSIEQGASAKRGGLATTEQTRSLRLAPAVPGKATDGAEATRQAMERYRTSLSLPGVKDEIVALKEILKGNVLLDAGFTVNQFNSEIGTGNYRIVHIASHGVFGDSADTSFIMAFDDVLSMNDLESLLHDERFQNNPIELLSLSACQTAEGSDRAPLGISGVAIKARARGVIGTLWPVEDNAAKSVMKRFYSELAVAGQTKTGALRQAQLELLHNSQSEHPFYWAPFVLIGNWL
jgi:CHAT domain-containing protein